MRARSRLSGQAQAEGHQIGADEGDLRLGDRRQPVDVEHPIAGERGMARRVAHAGEHMPAVAVHVLKGAVPGGARECGGQD
jgi:hypothetical protein